MTPIIHCNDGAAGGGRREREAYYNVDNGLLGRGAAAVANTPTPLRHSTSTNQQHEQQHDQGYGEGSSGGDGNNHPSTDSVPFSVPVSAVRPMPCGTDGMGGAMRKRQRQ